MEEWKKRATGEKAERPTDGEMDFERDEVKGKKKDGRGETGTKRERE